ncbi:hypothetical protein [Kocuria rosea]|uniref:hypothetical protein n=1 Tax=Kocuria rosea TaxID=1275 RepID=UPI0025B7878A|nr:hypothetical protein [Kocuria rosea]WJZ68370.1 hypothetical protein QR564_18135 [Kocuria rosea]
MIHSTPQKQRTEHLTPFQEAVAGYARAQGFIASVTTDAFPGVTVTLRPDPDAIFDLTRAALRRGDGPADFDDPQAPTGPGSIHHTWGEASARAYNRYHLTGRIPQYQRDLLVLATEHGIGPVHVHPTPLDVTLVLHQLLGLKQP